MKHWNIKMSAQENMLRLLRYVTETIVRLRPCCHCGPLMVLRRPLYFFVAATRNITLGDGHLIAVGPKFAVPFWQTGSLLCTLSQYNTKLPKYQWKTTDRSVWNNGKHPSCSPSGARTQRDIFFNAHPSHVPEGFPGIKLWERRW